MISVAAVAAAGLWLQLAAPPYTIVHTRERAAQAVRLAESIPAMVRGLEAALGSPPLPPSTLCLIDGDAAALHAPEPCDLGSVMPEWAAGIAIPERRVVIVRVDRAGGYPHRQLLAVTAHETAHLVEAEAAGGPGSAGEARLPPWFREGVAASVAHEGEWMDFLYLWTSPVAAADHPLAELARRFEGSSGGAPTRVAYAGAYSFVRHLTERHGKDFPARVLAGVREGLPFDAAFARAAGGDSLLDDERSWAASLRGPLRWMAWASSTWTLWAAITALVVLAWLLKRRRGRRVLERWEEEDRFDGF